MTASVGNFGGAYKGKRVFVTGHTGFKGSWACLWLQHLGAEVIGYSNGLPTDPAHYQLLNLPNITEYRADILEPATLREAIHATAPDLVLHLAAQPIVTLSYTDPVGTFATNIMGTAHALEACRGVSSITGIVCATSDKCYENVGKASGYTEADRMGGHDPYSASKGCAELVAASYRRSFADLPPMATVRAGNVIGGGDWAVGRLIPDAARAAANGTPLVIRHPEAVRPWQHVLEPLSGYLQLGQWFLEGRPEAVGGWNFSPNPADRLTVAQVLHTVAPILGITVNYEPTSAKVHEDKLLTLDSTKARTQLGWHPVWDNPTMLHNTAHWFAQWQQGQNLLSTTQLHAYTAAAQAQGLPWATSL